MNRSESPVNRIKVTDLQRSLSRTINEVALSDTAVVVEKSGLPVAVLVSYREFEEARRLAGLKALNQAVRAIGPIAEAEGWTEEDVTVEVDKAKRDVAAKKYGRRRKH